jgi:glutathione S-transferase
MYRLFGRKGSGSVAPQMMLEELGLPHEVVWVSKEEAQQPAYRKIHPQGRVPALQLPNQQVMLESAAMVIHLCEVKPGVLAPEPGSSAHAQFLQWMVFLSAGLYETYLRYFYSDRYGEAGSVKAAAAKELITLYAVTEQALNPRLLREALTGADFYLWMLSSWHDDTAGLYRRFPKLGRLADEISERPAVAKVVQLNQG